MTRTVSEVLTLAAELQTPEVSQLVRYTGPRGGQHVSRTSRWYEIHAALREDCIFHCSCCGEMVAYADLEDWACDFDDLEEGLVCSSCYEDEMGEDL